MEKLIQLSICLLFFCCSCSAQDKKGDTLKTTNEMKHTEDAIFGAGCFWCTEACFAEMKGVISVTPGYAGGTTTNPTYEEVCTGNTGHAEVAKITFDPSIISYDELLEMFWFVHNPTSLNRQGNDIGTQYRSAIFYTNEAQKELAEKYKKRLDESSAYPSPIVTEIEALKTFYPAEDYHNDYFKRNPNQPYCNEGVRPKVEKFKKAFHDKLK